MEESKRIKIHTSSADLPDEEFLDKIDLDKKSKRLKKLDKLEEKYKDKPKVAFHQLDDEGNFKLTQMRKDRIWTTLGWSLIGTGVGIMGVSYFELTSERFKTARMANKRDMMRVGILFGCIGFFTYYGYAKARQVFIKQKL